jgi:hypothetical protein
MKRQMISALDLNSCLFVLEEPGTLDSALRIDLRVTSHGGISEYDLIVVSLASKKARATSAQARRELSAQTPFDPIPDLTKASLQGIPPNHPQQASSDRDCKAHPSPHRSLCPLDHLARRYGGEPGEGEDGGMERGDWGGEPSVLDVAESDRAGERESTCVAVRVGGVRRGGRIG